MVLSINALLINGSQDHLWAKILRDALSSLATLKTATEEDAIILLSSKEYDLVLIDSSAVKDVPLLIARIRTQQPNIRTIVATSSPTWTRAREAFRAGAMDYIKKSFDVDDVRSAIKEVLIKKPLL